MKLKLSLLLLLLIIMLLSINYIAGFIGISKEEIASSIEYPYVKFVGGDEQFIGTIKKNEKLTHAFILKNMSVDKTVEIVKVKPSCGCLQATAAAENVLLPGDGKLKVSGTFFA